MFKGFSAAFALVAVVVWSSWGILGQAAAMRGPSGAHKALSPRERLEFSDRMRAAVSDPARITHGDVSAARKAQGEDAARLLETIRKAAR